MNKKSNRRAIKAAQKAKERKRKEREAEREKRLERVLGEPVKKRNPAEFEMWDGHGSIDAHTRALVEEHTGKSCEEWAAEVAEMDKEAKPLENPDS